MSSTFIVHRFAQVAGLRIFYREVGPPNAPTLLLLHGFPSSSHQFRHLMALLGMRYRVVAPDLPGFGYSDAPESVTTGGRFTYSFDQLANVIEAFCDALELNRFVLYMFDYGGPVGFRIAVKRPEWIAGLVLQNANAYDAGMSDMALGLAAQTPESPEGATKVRALLTPEMTRLQYLTGAREAERISPDGWTLDQHFLDLPGRAQIQVDLALNYHSNVALYPKWQAWLKQHQPPTTIVWGRNDPFFIEAGAHAYLRDLPDANLHLFDTGHFALEECAADIAPLVAALLDRTSAKG